MAGKNHRIGTVWPAAAIGVDSHLVFSFVQPRANPSVEARSGSVKLEQMKELEAFLVKLSEVALLIWS